MLNVTDLKKEFPILKHHSDLVYLDSAATALKPVSVIAKGKEYLEQYSANIARGLYPIAEQATVIFEAVRKKIARFIGANENEIIFTHNTTHAINMAANLIGQKARKGERIITTEIEHHSNYLPWKELARRKKMDFQVIPLFSDGKIDRTKLPESVNEKTSIVAFSAVSNVLGTYQPVKEIVEEIKKINSNTLVLVDAAQAIGHSPIDVQDWGADFVAFSAHKMFGPTGVGVLYGRAKLLQGFAPEAFGGGMVLDACADDTAYKESPYRFEAGTPNIGGVIAFGAAIEFIENLGLKNIRDHEKALSEYAFRLLSETFGENIKILGPINSEERGGVLAFTFDRLHPHDIAQILGEKNVCIRAGEHCAAPLHRRLGLAATARASFSVYNDESDIDKLIEGLQEARKILT